MVDGVCSLGEAIMSAFVGDHDALRAELERLRAAPQDDLTEAACRDLERRLWMHENVLELLRGPTRRIAL